MRICGCADDEPVGFISQYIRISISVQSVILPLSRSNHLHIRTSVYPHITSTAHRQLLLRRLPRRVQARSYPYHNDRNAHQQEIHRVHSYGVSIHQER